MHIPLLHLSGWLNQEKHRNTAWLAIMVYMPVSLFMATASTSAIFMHMVKRARIELKIRVPPACLFCFCVCICYQYKRGVFMNTMRNTCTMAEDWDTEVSVLLARAFIFPSSWAYSLSALARKKTWARKLSRACSSSSCRLLMASWASWRHAPNAYCWFLLLGE